MSGTYEYDLIAEAKLGLHRLCLELRISTACKLCRFAKRSCRPVAPSKKTMSCAAAFGEGVRFGLAVDTPKTAMTLRRAVHDLTPLHLVLVTAQRDDAAEQV